MCPVIQMVLCPLIILQLAFNNGLIINWLYPYQISTNTKCYFPIAFQRSSVSIISNSNMETVTWVTGMNGTSFILNHKCSSITGLALRVIAIGN